MPAIPPNLLFDFFAEILKDPATALLLLLLVLILGLFILLLASICQIIQTGVRIIQAKMWLDFLKLASRHKDPKVPKIARSLLHRDLCPKPRGQGPVDGFLALFGVRRKE